ncbi:hypothetical protein BDL97_12G070400 [Sphagnum fallax]|nr:hypothetical protein BDL97_12G070400 [Sphagnum fallax]
MSVAAGVTDAAITVRDKLRGQIGQTKVKRYWPGKAPEWAEEVGAEEVVDVQPSSNNKALELLRATELDRRFSLRAESDFFPANKDDARLRDEAVARHRQIRQAEIVSTREECQAALEAAELEEDEDDEGIVERRQRIKEQRLQRQREEEAALEEELEDEDEEEEESEYETGSEEDYGGVAMIKPVFVPKAERDTIAEREKLEAEEAAFQEAMKKKLQERKVETKQLVVEEIRKEEEIEKNREAEGDGGEIATDHETNVAEEYEAWNVRELTRIKRDRDDREAMEETTEWQRKNPKPLASSEKKWKFMQKYYHKGAFFQSESDDRDAAGGDAIHRRDFSAPTGEDKMDKTILPKVMQVKHFGHSGRTKWTHLVAEDTTKWDNPWTYNDPLRAMYNNKMAGMNRPIAKPAGSKKLKDWENV